MMGQFGYFVTKSTPHNSGYLPYFKCTRELRDHYGVVSCAPVSIENTRVRDWMKDSGVEQDSDGEVLRLATSHEYASMIIEARFTGRPFAFNGNVMNHGSIKNIPNRCCVEVPCLADGEGPPS